MSVLMAVALVGTTAAASPPEHLTLAFAVVETIKPSTNDYGSPVAVTWVGENGLKSSTVRATCSSFITRMFERAYGVDFTAWFGSDNPNSACYHDMIEVEDGFDLIEPIADVEPGNVVAIRYYDAGCEVLDCGNHTGCSSTGHTMLVAATPKLRAPTPPFVPFTLQYSLAVLDVTSDAHWVGDTRRQANPDDSDDSGVGTGTMRLYVSTLDPERPVVGYTWSTSPNSKFHARSDRDLVIGDYQDD